MQAFLRSANKAQQHHQAFAPLPSTATQATPSEQRVYGGGQEAASDGMLHFAVSMRSIEQQLLEFDQSIRRIELLHREALVATSLDRASGAKLSPFMHDVAE